MPEFDINDQHTRDWISRQLKEYKKKNPAFELSDLVHLISKKITVFSINDIAIDDEELFVVDGKICAIAPDLKDLPEFDWDDPESKAWAEAQASEFIQKYGKLTHEQLFELADLKMQLMKESPLLSSKEASNLAWEQYRKKINL